MITRPGRESAAMKGALAVVATTTTWRRPVKGSSMVSSSVASRSGPGRLNSAVFRRALPWPRRTRKIASPGDDASATRASAARISSFEAPASGVGPVSTSDSAR
jgi:hypothetical protein